MNQCNSSEHQGFYIHTVRQQYHLLKPLAFFHFLKMNRLSSAIGYDTTFSMIKFISPLCTVLIGEMSGKSDTMLGEQCHQQMREKAN